MEFKAEHDIKYYSSTRQKSKNPNTNRKMKDSGLIESKKFSRCKDIRSKDVDKQTNSVLEENERIKRGKRIHLLECLKSCFEQNTSFDLFKEQLIDLEESFINSQ